MKTLLCCCLLTWTLTASAAEPPIKNVLFIMSDDLKASVLPAYGNTVCKTPNLDQLSKAGMVFERAYCQGLACAPSRPSIMSSIYPESRRKSPTIGEHLQKHGMHTARVGKIFHMPVPHAQLDGSNGADVAACWTERYNTKSAETFSPGLYRLLNSKIVTREVEGRDAKGPNRMWATVEADREDGSDQADHRVATQAIELLRQRKAAGKPFFLGVGFVRPHFPMVTPKKFFDDYPQEMMKIPPQIEGDLADIPLAGHGPDGKGLTRETVTQALDTIEIAWNERIYTPLATLWVFLGQVLSADHSCRAAVARFVAHRISHGESPCSSQTGAYCKARKRLSWPISIE